MLPVRGATFDVDEESFQAIFQSMLPVRGATEDPGLCHRFQDGFQSMLPVRGATPAEADDGVPHGISIHAPRAGSDRYVKSASQIGITFQSMLPVRGATRPSLPRATAFTISIHAPRAGSDYRRITP